MSARLFLEERIALVRAALNERTFEFQKLLPEEDRSRFQTLVLQCLSTLDGFGPDYGGLEP